MKRVLGALLLVLVAACSSDGGATENDASPTPSAKATEKKKRKAPPASELPPRKRLKAAQLALSRATAGGYDLDVGVRGANKSFMLETGRFDALHEVLEIERSVPHPDGNERKPSWLVLLVRSTADTRFLQVDDWGPWEGCWMDLGSGLTDLLGVEVSAIPNIPSPVALVLGARFAPQRQRALAPAASTPSIVPAASTAAKDTITAHADGFTALEMFGVSGSVLLELDPAVEKAKVPVTLSFFKRFPDVVEEVRIDGPAAVAALRATDADLDQELTGYIRAARAHATFHRDVIPVKSWRPPPDKLLPEGATREQTCPANQG